MKSLLKSILCVFAASAITTSAMAASNYRCPSEMQLRNSVTSLDTIYSFPGDSIQVVGSSSLIKANRASWEVTSILFLETTEDGNQMLQNARSSMQTAAGPTMRSEDEFYDLGLHFVFCTYDSSFDAVNPGVDLDYFPAIIAFADLTDYYGKGMTANPNTKKEVLQRFLRKKFNLNHK